MQVGSFPAFWSWLKPITATPQIPVPQKVSVGPKCFASSRTSQATFVIAEAFGSVNPFSTESALKHSRIVRGYRVMIEEKPLQQGQISDEHRT